MGERFQRLETVKRGKMKNCGGYRISALIILLSFFILGLSSLSCRNGNSPIPICEIQGKGVVSPYFGQRVLIRGIVTADLEDHSPGGFYLQDEGCLEDQQGRSKGVFILEESGYDLVSRGDEVSLRGIVMEYKQETILFVDQDNIEILSVDNPFPKEVKPGTPWESTGSVGDYERLEGMLVLLPIAEAIAVNENNGEIWILPGPQRKSHQASELQGSSFPLKIFRSLVPQRLGEIKAGDVIENLKGIIRQDGSDYVLYLLDPAQVLISPSVNKTPDMRESLEDGNEEDQIDFLDQAGVETEIPESTPTYYPVELLLVEIFPNPTEEEPDGEWIEIFNPNLFGLPLTGIKIGDDADQSGKEGLVMFPPGYYIEAGEVLVIANQGNTFRKAYGLFPDFEMVDSHPAIPDMLPYPKSRRSSIQLSNSGDEVVLLDPWNGVVDGISYGNSSYHGFGSPVLAPGEGNSLERYPPERDRDNPGDWRERTDVSPGKLDRTPPTSQPTSTPKPSKTPTPTLDPTLTFTPVIPTPTSVRVRLLITEVMFNPLGAEPGGEWFEIYNPTNGPLPLNGVKVGDAAYRGDSEGMFVFPYGEQIQPGEIILIANQANEFKGIYGFEPDYELSDSDQAVLKLHPYLEWASGSIRLGNEGDELVMLDGWDEIVDILAYGSSAFDLFQPAVQLGSEGATLGRCPEDADTDSLLDWGIFENPSPGERNLCPPTITPSSSYTITLVPSSTTTSTVMSTPSLSPVINQTSTIVPTMINSVTPSQTNTITLPPTLTPSLWPTITASITNFPTVTSTIVPPTPTSDGSIDPVIILNEIHADPHPELGDANEDGMIGSDDDEFLEFVNIGEDPLDLSGWEISDAVRVRFTFPPNTILPRMGATVIFGGGEPEGEFGGSMVFASGTLGLNNNGDTIYLQDTEGKLWIQYIFGSEANQDQSLTRDPDLIGAPPFVPHSGASSAGNSLYSPGTRMDGRRFDE